jgi:hypothetical protein
MPLYKFLICKCIDGDCKQNGNLKGFRDLNISYCLGYVTADFVPISPILVTLMMVDLGFSETSVLTRATQRNISKDGILQHNSHIQSNPQTNLDL